MAGIGLQVLHNYMRTSKMLFCSIESGAKTYLMGAEKLTDTPYYIVYKEQSFEISASGVSHKTIRKVYYYKTAIGYIKRYLILRHNIKKKFSNQPEYCIKPPSLI